MIRVEVKSTEVKVKSGTSGKTGKPYAIPEQSAYAFFFDLNGQPLPYPSPIRVTLEDAAKPYPIGNYTFAPNSFYADQWGQVSCRLKLQPVAASLSAAKAA